MTRTTRRAAPARSQRRPMLEILEDRLVPGSVLNPFTLSMTCLDDSAGAAAEAELVGAPSEQASPSPSDAAPADLSTTASTLTALSDSPATPAAGDTSGPTSVTPWDAPDTWGDTLDADAFVQAAPAHATSASSAGVAATLPTGPVVPSASSLAPGEVTSRASAPAPTLNSFAAATGGVAPPSTAHAAAPVHTANPPSMPRFTNVINLPPNTAYNPSQIRTAYGLNLLPASNQGQGVTIGIVDELVDPTITTDLQAFSTQFGLPQLDGVGGDGTFTTLNDTAFATPGTSPGGNNGTSSETALDVEWAHAMAPKANIVLVFVPATGSLNNLFAEILHGMQFAASQPGVVAVSTSYGYFEGTFHSSSGLTTAQETSLNATYLATGAATNVAMTVSSGDYTLPQFPAVSPNVIAVGGTSLYTASAKGRYGYELVWGGISQAGAAGGGVSQAFTTAPTFQTTAGLSFAGRAIPDVSMESDAITGVAIYSANDQSFNGNNPWFQIGGTSLASPLFAGVLALAQQDRLAASKPILNSVQINTALYNTYNSASYSTYFHDVVLGNNNDIDESRFGGINVNGFNATTGYDLATGIGSPIGNMVVGLLSSV